MNTKQALQILPGTVVINTTTGQKGTLGLMLVYPPYWLINWENDGLLRRDADDMKDIEIYVPGEKGY